MKKKAGSALIIIGVMFIVTAIIMLLITPVHQNKDIKDKKDITEITQEGKSNITTEQQEKQGEQETSQEMINIEKNDQTQQSTEQSAYSINPEVYEWPCGSKYFQDWEEPKLVIEFAQYKEYYEQMAQQFLEYEGKNVEFYGDDDMFYFDECKNEGSVKVSYDKETILNLFEKSNIGSVYVRSDCIVFDTDVSDSNDIMYLYDETLTYGDSFPSEKDLLISDYEMVNIAPHWWWEDFGPVGF